MISPRVFLAASAFGVVLVSCDRQVTGPDAHVGPTATLATAVVSGGTALIRRGPSLNSDARIEGSVQMMVGDNTTFDGRALITGNLLVPGTPTVKLSGSASYGGTVDGSGSDLPTGYKITLNSKAKFSKLIRRTNPIALQSVPAPTAPTGTRTVNLSKPTDVIGAWATVRNLTLNSKFGPLAIPAGAYGDLTVNSKARVTLGVAGATQPAIYNFQRITVNGDGQIVVVGPVVVTVANIAELGGGAVFGAAANPEWLDLKISGANAGHVDHDHHHGYGDHDGHDGYNDRDAHYDHDDDHDRGDGHNDGDGGQTGGLTLNGTAVVYAYVTAPRGTVTINSDARLIGGLEADRLNINGNGVLSLRMRGPVVDPGTIDLFVRSIERVVAANGTLGPVDSIPSGAPGHYVAKIAVTPSVGNQTSAPVTCSVNVKPVTARQGATVITNLAGTISGPASVGGDALCSFDLTLAGNGNFDDSYVIDVTAQTSSAADIVPGNNTLAVKQLAIVRIDVSVDAITMRVAGSTTTDPATIKRTQTGEYHAIFHNTSSLTASVRCDATVGGVAFVFAAGANVFTIPGGGTADCTFNVTYPNLVVSAIVVTASVQSPLDGNLGNNVRTATTTVVGDGKFIGVAEAHVIANETRVIDFTTGALIKLTGTQNMEVTNLALFVTDAATPIGNFKLVGTASSGGVVFSKDSVGGLVPDQPLLPGQCITQIQSSPNFRNNHTVTILICAAPVPNQTGKQAITVSYTSAKSGGDILASQSPAVFGNSVTIDIRLSWALTGAAAGVTDFAAATVTFDLIESAETPVFLTKQQGACFKVTSAGETVVGGGATCH